MVESEWLSDMKSHMVLMIKVRPCLHITFLSRFCFCFLHFATSYVRITIGTHSTHFKNVRKTSRVLKYNIKIKKHGIHQHRFTCGQSHA